jgi:hypothetical protein
VYVRVTTGAGTSADVPAAQYTYTGGPVVTGLTPSSGPVGGGTTVVITGSGFTGATQVRFGNVQASFSVNSNTQITAVAPAQGAGTVFVRVTTGAGTSGDVSAAQYTYTGGPAISGVAPGSGPATGGTTVVITGSGFSGATAVTFDGVNAASFTVNSNTQITAISPAHAAGSVFIRVTTPGGTSAQVTAAQFVFTGTGTTTSYTLTFRWTLLSWLGIDGITIQAALSGNDGIASTNDISDLVTVIWRYNGVEQKWEGHFPLSANVPGVNQFNTLEFGRSYFFAISRPMNIPWVVVRGP